MAANSICVAIDFETAGYSGNSACAIGLTKLVNWQIKDAWYALIRPPSSRIMFTQIHGLRWRDLKDQKTFAELWPELSDCISDADFLMAHNAAFDRNVLECSCKAGKFPYQEKPFLCTLKGSRKALNIPSKSLDNVCRHFGITFNHHHAGSDSLACAQICLRLLDLGLTPQDMLLNRKN